VQSASQAFVMFKAVASTAVAEAAAAPSANGETTGNPPNILQALLRIFGVRPNFRMESRENWPESMLFRQVHRWHRHCLKPAGKNGAGRFIGLVSPQIT
jgi:hypothetical protein